MNKFGTIIGIATALLIVGGVLAFSNPKAPTPSPAPDTYEYFWGDGCPHCENVAKFMETWDKIDNIKLAKMEVWKNTNNTNIMTERAVKCGISKDELGVPFLYTPDGKCLVGDESIISLFKSL